MDGYGDTLYYTKGTGMVNGLLPLAIDLNNERWITDYKVYYALIGDRKAKLSPWLCNVHPRSGIHVSDLPGCLCQAQYL